MSSLQRRTGIREGSKAYAMAKWCLDVAQRFGCKRIYTSGAALPPLHHTARSRVWAVAKLSGLLQELASTKTQCSCRGSRGGRQGTITG